MEAQPNPLLEPLLQPINTRRLKDAGLSTYKARWMNTLPRHSNTWYRSVLCIIITLVCKLYFFLIANKIKKEKDL
jgi:hypothetical protein